jgi:hypothetical protein
MSIAGLFVVTLQRTGPRLIPDGPISRAVKREIPIVKLVCTLKT